MRRIIIMMAVAVVMSAAVACEKYDDGIPPKVVRAEFARMYPDAWDVEWEYQAGLWKVSFETGNRPHGTDYEAWYDSKGNWVDTHVD